MPNISTSKFSYRASIERLKEEYARRIAYTAMKKRRDEKRGPRPPSKLTDNSEPFIENPNCLADYCYISEQVRKRVEKWGPPQKIF